MCHAHQHVLKKAITEGVEQVAISEDDVRYRSVKWTKLWLPRPPGMQCLATSDPRTKMTAQQKGPSEARGPRPRSKLNREREGRRAAWMRKGGG
jgi:hypothetical protein